jgi:transmembrane sensor
MHYKDYSVEDFIQDEFFQQWVNQPTDDHNRYWSAFLEHYPRQHPKMEEAKQLLLLVKFESKV